jgi:membrane protein implicated in regulation of membrane protease activity
LSRADRGELTAVLSIGLALAALLAGLILLGVPIVNVASFIVAFAALVLVVSLIPSEWRSSEVRSQSGAAPANAPSQPHEPVEPPSTEGDTGAHS